LLFAPADLDPLELGLQREVRGFLAEELPRGTFVPGLGMGAPRDRGFSAKLAGQGWLGMALPARYGGHDRSAVERFVVAEELLRWGAPVGHHWVADRQTGPIINRFGSEEQKQRFLPLICRGEVSFAIGMSEPQAGSDLAAVRTSASRVDGGWVVNGTKVWTSGAQESDWFVVLCRTGESPEDRHAGLSQLIVDLRSDGIAITPIPFLSGHRDFNEVALEDVFVPDELVLGAIGEGWAQNTSELAHERGGPERWLSTYLVLEELLRSRPAVFETEHARVVLGDAAARLWALRRLSLSVARMIDAGGAPAVQSALVKEMATRFEQDLLTHIQELVALEPVRGGDTQFERLLFEAVLSGPSFTIRGGTNEILRSVAAKGLGSL
jgi:alkylation response protein AidB-like acyl-CoA dehydrogenase